MLVPASASISAASRLGGIVLGLCLFVSGAPRAAVADTAPVRNLEATSTLAGGATAVAVAGSHAYVARGAAGVDVVDRSSPDAPVVVANVLPGDGAAVYIRDVAVHAGHLYACNWDDVENGLTGKFTGVYVYDVSVPGAPVEVARIDWGSAMLYHTAAMVYDLAIAEVGGTPYAFFVSEITNAVEVFNIANPAVPTYAATLQRPATLLGVCEDVNVVGDTAYVAWLQGGVTSYDLSDLPAIEANNQLALDYGDLLYPALLMQHKGAIGNARGLAVTADGLTLAVSDDQGAGKLRLFDLTNPLVASPLGVYDPGAAGDPFDVRLDGTRAYVAWGSDGLRVIDIGNALAPVEVARYDTPNAKRSAAAGSRVLLADGTQGTLTLALRDSVTIVTSTWSKRFKRLTVTATSSAATALPPAVLTVVGRGTMTWNSGTGQYTFTQTVNTKPASVLVSSSWGGSASASVSQVK